MEIPSTPVKMRRRRNTITKWKDETDNWVDDKDDLKKLVRVRFYLH